MNKIKLFRWYAVLLLTLFLLPSEGWTQSINGPTTACVGNTNSYTPSMVNPAYIYEWTVNSTSGGDGIILSGNSNGASVLWTVAGGATVRLTVTDPQNNNAEVFQTVLDVDIGTVPDPFITTDVLLACQALNVIEGDADERVPPEFDSTNCQLVCENSSVMYHAQGAPGSVYTWSAVGAVAVNPSGADCEIVWGPAGYGQVTVTETNAQGCEGSTTICVEIIEAPEALFESQPAMGEPIVICENGEVVLADLSTGSAAAPIVSRSWDWGDGTTTQSSSGGQGNPVSHQYTTPGSYMIVLTVTNACGCSDSYEFPVEVMNGIPPVIECPAVVCEGDIVNYSVDQPCAPGSWMVEGGSITYQSASSLQVRWDQVDPETGFGYVMYQGCGQCPSIVTEPVPVVLQNGVIDGPAIICEGEQYVYRMPKWPATEFNWTVTGSAILEPTDQRNEIALTATGSGVIRLRVTYTNTVLQCDGSALLDIEVMPQATISGDSLICMQSTATYNLGGYVAGSWVLHDRDNNVVGTGSGATFSYFFNDPGVYRLSASGDNFCPPEDFFITVNESPQPPDEIIGPEGVCVGIPTRYDAGNPVPGTSFLWAVTNGTLNAEVGDETYITFSSVPATISVRRMTTDAAHCLSDPVDMLVHAAVPAMTLSGPDTVCHSTQVVYTVNYDEADEYEWSIQPSYLGSVVEDGNTAHPTILWNMPNLPMGEVAKITVNVIKCGSRTTLTKNVYVRNTPEVVNVVADPNPVCSGEPVRLRVYTNTPVNNAGSVTGNWGDGPMTSGSMPAATGGYYEFTHTYITDGQTDPVAFTPAITIDAPNGCTGTLTATGPQIIVNPRPIAQVSKTGPVYHCGDGWTEELTATITTGIGASDNFIWVANPATIPVPAANTSVFTNITEYGSYFVVVSNATYGCTDTSNIVNIIEDCSSTGEGEGDGSGGACDPEGPVITLDADPANCGEIRVTVSGVPAGMSFDWLLPDGVTFTGTPTATLLEAEASIAGVFTIWYKITNSIGCSYRYSIDVPVDYVPNLRAGISCHQAGGNYTVTLFDHSTELSNGLISNREYFDDGFNPIPVGANPFQVTTEQDGGSSVTYYEVITGPNGVCTASVNVTTPDFPSTSIALEGNPPQPACVEDVVLNFSNNSQGNGLSYLWSFGDNSTNANEGNPTIGKVYTEANPSNPMVTLTITDQYGCYASDGLNVSITDNPYSNYSMTAAPTPTCEGTPVTLTYNPSIGTNNPPNFTWYKEEEALGSTTNPYYTVLESGGYWVSGIGDYGCKVSTSDALAIVDVHHVPMVSISGEERQCVDQTFTLSAQDYGSGYTYEWSVNGAAAGNGAQLSQTLNTPGTYTYMVIIRDNQTGCERMSEPFKVTVAPPPAPPSVSFDIVDCNPYTVELHATGSGSVFNWNNGMMGPDILTNLGGPYQVTMTDDNGCRVQSSISVPKSPEEYLWVFPDGCFCIEGATGRYLIGPIAWMSYWAWLENGAPVQSGSGPMPNQPLLPGNRYNMMLSNGYCEVISPDMYFNMGNCPELIDGFGAQPSVPQSSGGIAESDINDLNLTPNPATDAVSIRYRYASGSEQRRIEVRDMLGRALRRFQPEQDSGIIKLSLKEYAAGMYQVILYRDGEAAVHRKLSVTK